LKKNGKKTKKRNLETSGKTMHAEILQGTSEENQGRIFY